MSIRRSLGFGLLTFFGTACGGDNENAAEAVGGAAGTGGAMAAGQPSGGMTASDGGSSGAKGGASGSGGNSGGGASAGGASAGASGSSESGGSAGSTSAGGASGGESGSSGGPSGGSGGGGAGGSGGGEPVCTPNARFCSDDAVRLCAEDGLSSTEEEACGSDHYCDAASATCLPGVCAANELTCDDANQIRFCNDDGSGYLGEGIPCEASESCEAGECKDHVCTPGETFCEGAAVRLCADNGLTSLVTTTCGGATPVCRGAGECVCSPGALRCGAGAQPEVCSESHEWVSDGEPCSNLAYSGCGEGHCVTRSLTVPGGTFNRSNDSEYPATVSTFRLDQYEVTVGQFRRFVDAVVDGWRPTPGSGKHTHLNAGSGLANSAASGGHESGWQEAWSDTFPSTKDAWDTALGIACNAGTPYSTWTPIIGATENKPVNCATWNESHAYCIWDGGFLPSEAEWNYAAAGGSEQRTYPWGTAAPGANTNLAIHGCYWNGSGTCSDATNIAPVGSAPTGNGRWGHADLAGNLFERTLDKFWSPYLDGACNDCASLDFGPRQVVRGGHYRGNSVHLLTTDRSYIPADRSYNGGFRCARPPTQ